MAVKKEERKIFGDLNFMRFSRIILCSRASKSFAFSSPTPNLNHHFRVLPIRLNQIDFHSHLIYAIKKDVSEREADPES